MKDLKLKKKKKGFTLIELIVVIAILAVLALIIVPRVSGYVASAKTARVQADAKTVQQAIEVYNTNVAAGSEINTNTNTNLVNSLGTAAPTSTDPTIMDVMGKLGNDTTVSGCEIDNLQNMSQKGF